MNPIALVGAGISLFGSSGPDKTKLAERTFNLKAVVSLARQGNVDAWLYLGAMGDVAPLPKKANIPGLRGGYGDEPAGWSTDEWGAAYAPIKQEAAEAFRGLAPQFAASGVASAQVVALNPSLNNNPVLIAKEPTVAEKLQGVQWWVWLLVAALVFLTYTAMR